MIDHIPPKLAYDYKFERKIGEGANGETWLARQRFTNRLVAVKCLRLDKIDDIKTLELFERESELLKSIHVDGVPTFYDYYAPTEKGSGFLVQEYVQAPSIQSLLDQHESFTEQQIIDIAEKVAGILYHLETEYQPPIIHRDIKPSNILYRPADGVVYLIDFGAVANPQKRTGGSTVAGTFGYMAPEQIMGNVEIQSDYYALGATLLHMLTNIPPYELDSDLFQIDVGSALKAHHIEISAELCNLLTTLLNPKIDKRPPNALALLAQIHDIREAKRLRDEWIPRIVDYLKKGISWLLPVRTRTRSDSILHHTSGNLLTIQQIEEGRRGYERCSFVTRNWKRCDGYIRRFAQIKHPEYSTYLNALEYTFEVQNNVWCGYCITGNLCDVAALRLPSQFPVKCSVLYNPADPRENGLEYIY